MRKILLSSVVLCFSAFVFAQNEPPSPPAPPNDKKSEEIIIRNNGDKEMNLTVQINGDSILVNGKPLSEYKNDDITINKKKIMIHDGDRIMAFDLDNMQKKLEEEQKQWDRGQKDYADKEIIKPFLGVTTEKADKGVKITEVVKGSAAEKAGLKEGDIITKINDKKIDDPEMLSDVVTSFKPKDGIKIYYKRDGKEKNVTATLGERKEKKDYAYLFHGPKMHQFQMPEIPQVPNMELDDDNDIPYIPEAPEMMPRQKKIGLKIQDTEDGKVKVLAVEDSSAAAKAGLKEGDIITEIDGEKINNTDDARDQLHSEEGKNSYDIKVDRKGTEMNFDVKIPKKLKTANL